jgi:hypothetical protein
MNGGAVADATKDLGVRFRFVSLLPVAVLAAYVLALAWSGAPGRSPDLRAVTRHAQHIAGWATFLLLVAAVVVALIAEPLQITLVRLLEGYWGQSLTGRLLAAPGTAFHRARRRRIDALARQNNMPHADFLQLVLSDEVTRREAGSIALRAKNAGLDPAMRTETWDPTAAIRYDQRLWNELISLRFLDGPHGALILGPVGTGKHTSPPRWATSPSAAAAPSTWPAPTSCSNASPQPASTTPSTTNTAA